MRVLVTGGAGFLGSHLVERLLERGDHATVVDDLSSGRPANLDGVRRHPGFLFQQGSVRDVELVDALVGRAEAVVHLAAVVGVRRVLQDPLATMATNVEGTRHVFEAAARRGIPCLFASSSEVYGARTDVPFREDDRLLQGMNGDPRWSYARSKVVGEELAREYGCRASLPVITVRLFNVIGSRQSSLYGMVLPNFVRQALAGQPVTIFGTGEQTRSFLHVRDAVSALLLLLETPAARGRVFNVGGEHEISIGEVAELVRRETGSRLPVRHISYGEAYGRPVADLPRRLPDLARIKATTGFVPHLTLVRAIHDLAEEHAGAVALVG